MGGSFVALPMLTSKRLMAMSQHTAHGTSMATVFFTSIGGCYAYSTQTTGADVAVWDWNNPPESVGNVHLPATLYLATTASAAAIVGARISKALPARALKISLGVFMLCMVPAAHMKKFIKDERTQQPTSAPAVSASTSLPASATAPAPATTTATTAPATPPAPARATNPFSPLTASNLRCSCIGIGSGLLAGLFGVGGGAITVPALALFTPLDFKMILGTSLAMMLPVASTGALTHYLQGTMLPRIGLPLGLGSLTGSYLGGRMSGYIHEDYLRDGYSALMLVLGSRTLYHVLRVAK
jgi:uncharacterized membrane protein YfcA